MSCERPDDTVTRRLGQILADHAGNRLSGGNSTELAFPTLIGFLFNTHEPPVPADPGPVKAKDLHRVELVVPQSKLGLINARLGQKLIDRNT